MISRKLAHQLNALKAIKPRTEWKDRTREILLVQISAQESAHKRQAWTVGMAGAYMHGACTTVYRHTFEQLFARPLVLSGALSVVVVGALSIVVASQGSMPGDPLYTVKRTEESVRIVFVSPADRPTFQLDLAQKRLEELSRLSEKSLTPEEELQKASILAQEADESISTAHKELLRLTKETPEKAVQIATQVKEQAEKIASPAVFARLDETKGAALQVIVEKKDAAHIADSKVAEHLEEAISELEARLARLQSVRAAGFRGEEGEQAEKAKDALDGARDSLTRNDFSIALSGITQSRKIIAEGEKQLSNNGDAANDGEGLK